MKPSKIWQRRGTCNTNFGHKRISDIGNVFIGDLFITDENRTNGRIFVDGKGEEKRQTQN